VQLLLVDVIAVAARVHIFPPAIHPSLRASVVSAVSHVLWSRRLLLLRCHSVDRIYREADLGSVSHSQLYIFVVVT